ncbi:MAG: NAD(P)H-hydrate epimerase, partial [Anaerovoracaceae bacterium]
LPGKTAIILCVNGNTGGDGFVVARILMSYGAKVSLLLVEGKPTTPDAMENYKLLEEMGAEFLPALPATPEGVHLVVDALYGTGFHGKLNTGGEAVIHFAAEAKKAGSQIFSLDIPSGLPGDLAQAEDLPPCVTADFTIAFHSKKPVHENPKAQPFLGKTIVVDIGIRDILAQPQKKTERGV